MFITEPNVYCNLLFKEREKTCFMYAVSSWSFIVKIFIIFIKIVLFFSFFLTIHKSENPVFFLKKCKNENIRTLRNCQFIWKSLKNCSLMKKETKSNFLMQNEKNTLVDTIFGIKSCANWWKQIKFGYLLKTGFV